MSRNTIIVIVAIVAALGGCCVLGVGVLALGATTDEAAPERPATALEAPRQGVLGEWIDCTGPRDFFRRLRDGQAYESFESRHVGQGFSLALDGSCTVDQLFGQTVGGCLRGSWVSWDDCRWRMDGDELTFTLGQGTRRVIACTALSETTVAEPGKVDRRRVALQRDGTLSVTVTEPVELTTSYRRVE